MVNLFHPGPQVQLPDLPPDLLEKAGLVSAKIDALIRMANPGNDSLLDGRLGLVLYFFTLYEAKGNPQDAAKARQLLEEVFSNINSGKSSLANASFSKGLSGLLYLVHYLSEREFVDFDVKEYRPLEEYLFRNSLYQVSHDFNDYLHGGFGPLFYFLQRLPDPQIETFVRKILEKVFENAVQTRDTFWLKNYLTSEEEKKEINFSLSHGQCGFFILLLQAFEQGIFPEKIYEAVMKGTGMILRSRQEIDEDANKCSFFPIHIKEPAHDAVFRNRLAWCYGDLNEVLLLYRAGKLFGEGRYESLADLMGTATVIRNDEPSTLCSDAHFCHGTAGLAQFYRTLLGESKLQPYADAHIHWIQKTVDFVEQDLQKGIYQNKEAGLLDGLVGIALTLLQCTTNKELGWSRFLLL